MNQNFDYLTADIIFENHIREEVSSVKTIIIFNYSPTFDDICRYIFKLPTKEKDRVAIMLFGFA